MSTLLGPPSPLSAAEQARHSAAYKMLHKRIVEAGFYKTRYITGYGPEIVRYTLFATLAVIAYYHKWFITSAFFLGLFWHQVTFTAHDLGHVGVTHDWALDRIIAIFIADFLGGLSIGWWVDVSSLPPRGHTVAKTYDTDRIITLTIVSTLTGRMTGRS